MFGKRQFAALAIAVCLSPLTSTTAAPFKRSFNPDYHCGEGVIADVIVGGYSLKGFHLDLNWASQKKPPISALYTGNSQIDGLVQFLASDLDEGQLRAVQAAAYLAFANGYYVRVASKYKIAGTETPDCKRATELQFTRAE